MSELRADALPSRVVVDQHGHYWRDFGDYWSMCPVSDENVATEPVAIYVRARWSEASRLAESIDAVADALNAWDVGEGPRPDTHRHWSRILATLDAARQSTVDVEDDWRWECSSCDRPVTPKGMCETCGTFGVLRLTESIARAYAEVDWPTLANVIREVDGNHDLGAGELAERILAHPAMRAARQPTVDVEALRLDHHALTHLIARARCREDAIHIEDNRLAEVLLSEMKAAGWPVDWSGPSSEHYGAAVRVALAAQETPERLGSDE